MGTKKKPLESRGLVADWLDPIELGGVGQPLGIRPWGREEVRVVLLNNQIARVVNGDYFGGQAEAVVNQVTDAKWEVLCCES